MRESYRALARRPESLIYQDKIWVDKEGREHALSALGDAHLRHLIRFLEERADWLLARVIIAAHVAMLDPIFGPGGDAACDAAEQYLEQLDEAANDPLACRRGSCISRFVSS